MFPIMYMMSCVLSCPFSSDFHPTRVQLDSWRGKWGSHMSPSPPRLCQCYVLCHEASQVTTFSNGNLSNPESFFPGLNNVCYLSQTHVHTHTHTHTHTCTHTHTHTHTHTLSLSLSLSVPEFTWQHLWNAKYDKMAAELPESAYSNWTIGTWVMECVGRRANVITFEGTFWRTYLRSWERFDERIYVHENVLTNVFTFMRTFWRTHLRSWERFDERTYVHENIFTNVFTFVRTFTRMYLHLWERFHERIYVHENVFTNVFTFAITSTRTYLLWQQRLRERIYVYENVLTNVFTFMKTFSRTYLRSWECLQERIYVHKNVYNNVFMNVYRKMFN